MFAVTLAAIDRVITPLTASVIDAVKFVAVDE